MITISTDFCTPSDYQLNTRNKEIAKAIQLIDYNQLSSDMLREMKITQGKKAMLKVTEQVGFEKGFSKGYGEKTMKVIQNGLAKNYPLAPSLQI